MWFSKLAQENRLIDKLHRSDWAKRVSKSISLIPQNEKTKILTLDGHWGSGKTFAVQMIQGELTASGVGSVIINARSYKLTQTIEDWVCQWVDMAILNGLTGTTLLQAVWNFLIAFLFSITRVKPPKILESNFSIPLALLAILAALTASPIFFYIDSNQIPQALFGVPIAQIIISILFGIGTFGLFSTMIIAIIIAGASIFHIPKTLIQKRLLSCLIGKVLIVIDDLDRVDAETLKLILNGLENEISLPNIHLLLPMNTEVIIGLLDKAHVVQPEIYFKRYSHMHLRLPAISSRDMTSAIADAIIQVLPEVSRDGLEKTIVKYLLGFFNDLRDVQRYTEALRFYVNSFRHNGHIEVYPLDAIMLEILRLFEPELYLKVSKSYELLTGPTNVSRYIRDSYEMRKREEASALVMAGKLASKESLTEFIKLLFQPVTWAFTERQGLPEIQYKDLFQDNRVAHKSHFHKYFEYHIESIFIADSQGFYAAYMARDYVNVKRELKILFTINEKETLERLDAVMANDTIPKTTELIEILLQLEEFVSPEYIGLFARAVLDSLGNDKTFLWEILAMRLRSTVLLVVDLVMLFEPPTSFLYYFTRDDGPKKYREFHAAVKSKIETSQLAGTWQSKPHIEALKHLNSRFDMQDELLDEVRYP